MTPHSAITTIVSRLGSDVLCVSSLGRVSEILFSLRPASTLFLDSMGDVTATSMGMAVGAPDVQVFAFDTDGSFLMNLSVLPVLGTLAFSLRNWGLAIVDNATYESGGGLPSRSSELDWSQLFGAVGVRCVVAETESEIPDVVLGAGSVVVLKIQTRQAPPPVMKDVDGIASRNLVEARVRRLRGLMPRRPAVKS